MPRERPVVRSTRLRDTEDARLRALAVLEGASICETMHRLLMRAVDERLAALASEAR